MIDYKDRKEENQHFEIKKFEKLTPINNAELGIYDNAISFAMDNNDVNNIALTGAYCSGKSSILLSYEMQHTDQKFIHISLANFDNKTTSNGETKNQVVKDNILEGKIINQLIYQIPKENIPRSNFKIIKDISWDSILKRTLLGIMFIIFQCHLIFYNYWHDFAVNYTLLKWLSYPYWMILSSVMVLLCIFVFIYHLIDSQKYNFIKKLKIQDNEIEMFNTTEESIFDKYLNEIIYIFEHSNADAIVFEDIDRFDSKEIFRRLREINIVINRKINTQPKEKRTAKIWRIPKALHDIAKYEEFHIKDFFALCSQEKKTNLKFIYMLRDDLFHSKERTKFFDFIIPVIPVVDNSNSYDQLIKILQEEKLLNQSYNQPNEQLNNQLNRVMLLKISLYIDDMRILKNICNEYKIYSAKLKDSGLKNNKIFAIIVYKNIFPDDFQNLQLGKGYVYRFFKNRKKLEKILVAELPSKIDTTYPHKTKAERAEITRQRTGEIELYKLQNYIQDMGFDRIVTTIFETDEIAKPDFLKNDNYHDLIKFLLSDGYIDESYSDYISYFYAITLSSDDKMFLRNVISNNDGYNNITLKNVLLIEKYLESRDYKKESIINVDFVHHILKTYDINSDKVNNLFTTIKSVSNYKFVADYLLKYPDDAIAFVKKINEVWPDMIQKEVTKDE